jgi:acetolactate synthase I/II/III large subunit
MTQKKMNGAESLVHTLVAHDLKVCFANPGTSEMHFVAALDRIPGIRCIPGLQENVVTGMADGYARVTREPAVTLLHCGSGFSNGIANIQNARKARVPMLNVGGDVATDHKPYDPPLAQDIQGLAKAASDFVLTTRKSDKVGSDAAKAIQAARTAPGKISTLILPSNASWSDGGKVAKPLPVPKQKPVSQATLRKVAKILREKSNVALLIGGNALLHAPQQFAAAIQAKFGCRIITESINGFHQRGRGRIPAERIPYPAQDAIALLSNVSHIITVCARGPVGFFSYPSLPSLHYPKSATITELCDISQDAAEALQALAEELGAKKSAPREVPTPDMPRGRADSAGFAQMLSNVMPENAIIADESITFGWQFHANTLGAPPCDWTMVTGGSIGYGMPVATGAAVAGKGRRVINLQADGSAMYTIQSLWTQAREKLPVTTVIFNNSKYQILIGEYYNVGANPGPTAMNMLDLANPDLDFVKMANSMGVEAARTDTLEGCAALMRQSFKSPHPFLIDLKI